MASLFLALFLVALTTVFTCSVVAYNNGVGKLPVMAWNSWNQFACNIDESLIIQTIDAMVAKNLTNAGYQYVNIDDCWHLEARDPNTQQMVPDPKRFPRGIKYVADYAHSKGVKLGIYSDVGLFTCQHRAGSYGHYELDANTFASWGIDLLKLDFCYLADGQADAPWVYYTQMSKAMNATGRPMVFSICNWGHKNPWEWASSISHMWRTTGDINASYKRMLEILDVNENLHKYSGAYAFNDPDMLEIGVSTKSHSGLTQREAKSHFSLWSMMNSPLILGNDLRSMDTKGWVYQIITNRDIIALNQHPLARQAVLVKEVQEGPIDDKDACKASSGCRRLMVFTKQLDETQGSAVAVAIFNRGSSIGESQPGFSAEKPTVSWSDLGLSGQYSVVDLWEHKQLGTFSGSFTPASPIEQHDISVYLFTRVGKQ